jgi:hypothetical protein
MSSSNPLILVKSSQVDYNADRLKLSFQTRVSSLGDVYKVGIGSQ